EARRTGGRADVEGGEVGDRRGLGSGGALDGDDGLRGRVVRGGEVDRRLALVRDGALLQVDVVVLRAGGGRVGPGRADPDDLGGEAELLGDRVGHGGLEALAGLGRVVDDVRVVRGLAGGDRELALGEVRVDLLDRGGAGGQADEEGGGAGDGAEGADELAGH